MWRPAANNTTVINKGAIIPGIDINKDMDEQKREDGKIDIGADEQSTGPVIKPVKNDNTGPQWINKNYLHQFMMNH